MAKRLLLVTLLLAPSLSIQGAENGKAPSSVLRTKKAPESKRGSEEKLQTAQQSLFGYNANGPSSGSGAGVGSNGGGPIGGSFGGLGGGSGGIYANSLGPGSSGFGPSSYSGGSGAGLYSGGPGGFSLGPGSFSPGPNIYSSSGAGAGGFGGPSFNGGGAGFGGGFNPSFGQQGGFGPGPLPFFYPGGGNGVYQSQPFRGPSFGTPGIPTYSSGGFGSTGAGAGGFNSYPELGYNPQFGGGQSDRNVGFVNQAFGNPIYNRGPSSSSSGIRPGLGSLQVGNRLDVNPGPGSRALNYFPGGTGGGFSPSSIPSYPNQFDFGRNSQFSPGGSPYNYNNPSSSSPSYIPRPNSGPFSPSPYDYSPNAGRGIGGRNPPLPFASSNGGTTGPNRLYQGVNPAGAFGRGDAYRFSSDESDN